MKFEASRAESLIRELGDPRFAGTDGEARVADFVAERFAGMGLVAERREVTGSRFPQRVAPWLGWLGYGILVTSLYGLVLAGNGLLLFLAMCIAASCPGWIVAVDRNRIRPGRTRPPLETAPVLMATRSDCPPHAMRVVFQAVMSGVRADPFQFAVGGRSWGVAVMFFLVMFPPLWAGAILLSWVYSYLQPGRVGFAGAARILTLYAYPAFLVPLWVGIVWILLQEYRYRRTTAGREGLDRRGLALLLEMARTWPWTGSRAIAPIFVVAGGQHLDYAGSREVVRMLDADRATEPSLLVLFFEPGAGEELWFSTNDPFRSGLADVVEESARSLWIPCRRIEDVLESLWPFVQDYYPALALIGSDPRAFGGAPAQARGLQGAAQLGTEVALRWSKRSRGGRVPASST